MDSGGFKGYSQNVDITPQEVLGIYDIARLKSDDKVISLDYAPLPEESPRLRIKKIKNSIKNFNLMKPLQNDLLPVVHGWSKKEMEISLNEFQDEPMLSFPSYFTLLTNNKKDSKNRVIRHKPHRSFQNPDVKNYLNGYFPRQNQNITTQKLIVKRFIDFINYYKKRKLTGRVHILGMSAGLAMQIMAYTGVFKQWDSANWRVKANHL